jgi:hypothetical protein
MNIVIRLGLLIPLAIGLSGVYRSVSAQEAAMATKHVLQATYIDSGYYGSAGLYAPANVSTPIGNPLTVSCPGTAGTCTIQADLWIQSVRCSEWSVNPT